MAEQTKTVNAEFMHYCIKRVWMAEGASNRVYLLGSVHLLRRQDHPLPQVIDAAYDDGARISSNSWGNVTTAAGLYNAASEEYDELVRDAVRKAELIGEILEELREAFEGIRVIARGAQGGGEALGGTRDEDRFVGNGGAARPEERAHHPSCLGEGGQAQEAGHADEEAAPVAHAPPDPGHCRAMFAPRNQTVTIASRT